MFGTTLATSPIMSSNFVGTRLFGGASFFSQPVVGGAQVLQNSLFDGIQLFLDTSVSNTEISQVHNLQKVDSVFASTTQAVTISQNHSMGATGLYLGTFDVPNAPFSQNHVITGQFLSSNTSISIGTLSQNHVMLMNSLTLGQVTVGTTFVNPSTKRIVNATDDSFNYTIVMTGEPNNTVLVTGEPNIVILSSEMNDTNRVILLNPDGNKYS